MVRVARHLTQAALADLCGVSREQVARWESDLNIPSPPKLERLTKVLRCRLTDLFPYKDGS